MSNTPPNETDQPANEQNPGHSFPVVGIGASAGGLEAFEKFFTSTPPDTGMAFVLVQHLDPNHESMLVDLIRRYTRMTVLQVTDAMTMKPDHVYIIPPNRDLALLHGELHLMEPEAPRGFRLPIDFFFRSLAEDLNDRAICIVLSGIGSDGTLGLKAVKEVGGLAIAQRPDTAKYNGMPTSAIATEMADFVLPPGEMPQQLVSYVQHAQRIAKDNGAKSALYDAESLQKIFIVLRSQTGHDFSQYKKNTILRRIERRMAVNQIESFKNYLRYVRQNPLEVDTLFKDLLIGVTRFFRDQEAFDVIEQEIIPAIFADRPPEEDVRLWVCACSTGEEAYSYAILLKEFTERHGQRNRVQIFATDIDNHSIEKARHGVYPDNIAADVGQERLERFFTAEDNTYQVNSDIRDLVIFATQNIVKDPPFSNMDLISCRNLLIYLDGELQRKVIPLFHYALRKTGYLVLGTSETLGEHQQAFDTLNRKQKIFQKISTVSATHPSFNFPLSINIPSTESYENDQASGRINMRDVTERILLEDHVPVAILINERADILYTHGRTGKYLEIVTGGPSNNVLKLARDGLKIPLTTAVRKVIVNHKPVVHNLLYVRTNGETQPVTLIVQPVTEPASVKGLILILIEPLVLPEEDDRTVSEEPQSTQNHRIAELEQDLNSTRQYLQTTIEELETSNEELKATNEELQSSNEELQSTNEELETTKEELQSINEELMTVNTELEDKINALSRANNDLNNLLASIGVAIIFLDMDLNIQRFNPSAAQLINLIDSDVGRPVTHIVPNFDYSGFGDDATYVLDTLEAIEKEIQTSNSRWFMMRMRPYRTVRNMIAGVIVTFAEITQQKIVQEELALLNNVVEEAYTVVIVTGPNGTIEYVNAQYERLLGYDGEEVLGQHFLFSITSGFPEDASKQLKEAIKNGEIWRGELEFITKDGQELIFLATLLPLHNPDGSVDRHVLIHDDITEIKQIEKQLSNSEKLYRALARRLPDVAILVFDHDLRYVVAEGANLERAGYQREEVEGKSFFDIMPKQRQAQLEPFYKAALAGEERTMTYTSINGEEFYLQAVPLGSDQDNDMGGMIVIHSANNGD